VGALLHREARLKHSRRAAIELTKFAIATIVGYLIWSAFLWKLDPLALAANTFICLFLFHIVGEKDRRDLLSINVGIFSYTLRYAISTASYWFSFWIGIYISGSASLALAMLALTMVVTPLMVRSVEEPEDRSPLPYVILTGITLLSAVVLVELNLNWDELTLTKIGDMFHDWRPFALFGVTVLSEGFQDRTSYALKGSLERRNINRNNIDALVRQMTIQSFPMCLGISLIALAVWKWRQFSITSIDPLRILWIVFWCLILGFIGSAAKIIFVRPLQSQHLDPLALPPVMAGRQILYLLLSVPLYFVVSEMSKSCNGKECVLFNSVIVNQNIVPHGKQSYAVGLGLALGVWAVWWVRLFYIGFFKRQLTE
jgi:hypothetical protein